jgi:nucleotide-binding universal stress UspA family protein
MSPIRELLVHIDDTQRASIAWQYAAALARSLGATPCALVAPTAWSQAAYLNPETAAIATQMASEQLQTLRTCAESLVATVPGAELRLHAGDPMATLLAASRSTDLLVLSQRDPEGGGGLAPDLASRLLMGAACPLLFMPHIGAPAGAPASQVLLAWSGTRESARALHDALPLLQQAQRVELVGCVHADVLDENPEPPQWQAVQQHLGRHGVQVQPTVLRSRTPSLGERLARGWTPDASVAETLLSHAADSGADLIVAGGYGHSRAWELVLGGVTRSLLQSMTVPVLFSH